MTDPKAKLQEEIERRRLIWAKNMAEQFERPFEPSLGVVPFNEGASVALELMQAREERLVEALRFYANGDNWDLNEMTPTVWDETGNIDAGNTAKRVLEELGLAEGGESGED